MPAESVTRIAALRPILRVVTIAWFAFLIVGSLQPARPGFVKGIHPGIHWIAFAVGALLLFAVSRNRRQEIQAVIAMLLLGLLLEYAQHLVYRNSMEWWDVRDDTMATLAAFGLYQLTNLRKPAPDPPAAPT